MYFWNIKKLKKELKEATLSESESFKYLIASVILLMLAIIPLPENNNWDMWNAVILGIITVFGTYYIYKCNGGANGSNFLQRFLSLDWVVGIRWLVLFALPVIIIYFTLATIILGVSEVTRLSEVIFFNLLGISYFWLIGRHIKDVANSSK